ncbi:MAG: cytochrome c-type biogenesis protein CcmH, partial [Pseudomonadota bacterium]|nr:cytochrome c-type biogenesis protein CcmH [Pseudomonadota bacterium]
MTFAGLARWNVLRHLALAALLAFALAPLAAFAQVATNTAPLEFTDRAEAERFHALVAELRCVKCQNQSLADSDALIAQDLRREVLTLMRDGKSDDEVKQFLVARYGEFVLYRPQVQSSTWLLWFGPALLLIAGAWVIVVTVRRRRPR